MSPRTMRALADLADALREEAAAQEQAPPVAEWLKPSRVAEELALGHTYVLELIARGTVAATRYGRTYRVERGEVERLKAEGVPLRAARGPRALTVGGSR